MKIKREFKIGVFAIIVILVSWWGITWLNGQNLLKSYNTYYVNYDEVSKDLKVSSRVYIRGVNVGDVRDIELKGDKVVVEIAVDGRYANMIPDDTKALITEGMMGGAQIILEQGSSETIAGNGATLEGEMDAGLLGVLADEAPKLMDNLNATITKLEETVDGVNLILNDNRDGIQQIVANLETLSEEINAIVSGSKDDIDTAIGDLSSFTTMLKNNTAAIESMLGNLDKFSGTLADSDLVENLNSTVEELNGIIATIESGEGSVGKLLNDDDVYNSIDDTINSLNLLLTDIKENPKRYINISVFGKSEEEIAAKQAKKEAKEAKRAAKRDGKQQTATVAE